MPQDSASSTKTAPLGMYEAILGPDGAVTRGEKLSMRMAVEHRKKGYNVVVCGPDPSSNRVRAEEIEKRANGNVVHHGPSATAGRDALWHYQPNPRGPKGHTFYETVGRSARVK